MSLFTGNDNNIDYYQLLGIELTANESEIRKAYRKKALSCHPDKNPDNPEAVKLFHELSKALDILTNDAEKSKYDRELRARKAAEVRHRQLDSKRQKLKEELERRERNAASSFACSFPSSTTFSNQYAKQQRSQSSTEEFIENLRRESIHLLDLEQKSQKDQWERNLRKQGEAEEAARRQQEQQQWRLKIKWKDTGGKEENGGYTHDILMNYLKKYGDILALVVSSSKNGRAVIEFQEREAAQMAVDYEKGNPKNPLQISWINGPKDVGRAEGTGQASSVDNFEELVMKRLRQVEERKRLMEEMLKADREEDETECGKEKRKKS